MFPFEWKKAILTLATKKAIKKTLKITTQFLYFLSAGKFLKDSVFNEMFTFFLANNLLAPNQPGFKPGDFCINQLLSIVLEVCSSFDDGFEVRSVFLNISDAFDKVWHEWIIFKLKRYFG